MHFTAAFPLWLAPEQVRVLTVSQKFDDYAKTVVQRLLDAGIRAGGDFDAEKIGAKIRKGRLDLVPYLCVVGAKEEENGTVALRSRKEGELGEMSVESLIEKLAEEVKMKVL